LFEILGKFCLENVITIVLPSMNGLFVVSPAGVGPLPIDQITGFDSRIVGIKMLILLT
jgi:hypothetical protein